LEFEKVDLVKDKNVLKEKAIEKSRVVYENQKRVAYLAIEVLSLREKLRIGAQSLREFSIHEFSIKRPLA